MTYLKELATKNLKILEVSDGNIQKLFSSKEKSFINSTTYKDFAADVPQVKTFLLAKAKNVLNRTGYAKHKGDIKGVVTEKWMM